MKRKTAEVLEQFLGAFGNPPGRAIENSQEYLLDLFASSNVQFLEVREMSVTRPQPFRFAWVAGIALAVVLVSVVVWRQGPPFSAESNAGKADEHAMSKSSAQQAGVTLQATMPQDAFEVASIKLLSPSSEAGRMAKNFEQMQVLIAGCPGGYMGRTRVDPGRLTIPAATVLTLVMAAYGEDCITVEGGPEWAQSDHYEIIALLPPGTPVYTMQDFVKGEAPELQRMLQKLLRDRFQLVLKREQRETSVYTLSVATPGKLKVSPDETRIPNVSLPAGLPPPMAIGRGRDMSFVLPGEHQLSGHAVSVSTLAKNLRQPARRIVVDKTGFSGLIDYDLRFASVSEPAFPTATPAAPSAQQIPPLPGAPLPMAPVSSLRDVLADQLGLKLESAKMPVEVLIIQSVERPSEN